MTIKEAQLLVDQWINSIGIRYYNELTNMAILTEEVGEVARLMSRLYGEQSFKTEEAKVSAKDNLPDEMADEKWSTSDFEACTMASSLASNLTERFTWA